MEILIRQFEADCPPSLPVTLLSGLKGDFTPLITSIKQEYWTKLGASPNFDNVHIPDSELAGGELYLSKTGNLLYFKVSSDLTFLECGAILKNQEKNEFDFFFTTLSNLIQQELRIKDVEWKQLTKEEVFEALVAGGTSLNAAKDEIAVAGQLQDQDLLRVLLRVHNASSFSSRDLSGVFENGQALEAVLECATQMNLLTRDFVVLCKGKGQQIIKVSSRQAIEEASQKGLKCFLCGKSISEELVEEIFSCTELARKLVRNGYWMRVRILEALGKIGIKGDEIFQQQDADMSNLCFFSSGEIIVVAPVDRKWTLSDAYGLTARLSVNQASLCILVSVHPVSDILKQFLIQSNPDCVLHFLETFEGLEEKLDGILRFRCQAQIRKLIEPFSRLTSVSFGDLVAQKFFPDNEEDKQVVATPPSQSRRKR